MPSPFCNVSDSALTARSNFCSRLREQQIQQNSVQSPCVKIR
uniref:Uncharacterized protein n=1 Tax=Anopheles dirus TaxID=7168 RepID=A0A182NWZ7_9DIPT